MGRSWPATVAMIHFFGSTRYRRPHGARHRVLRKSFPIIGNRLRISDKNCDVGICRQGLLHNIPYTIGVGVSWRGVKVDFSDVLILARNDGNAIGVASRSRGRSRSGS